MGTSQIAPAIQEFAVPIDQLTLLPGNPRRGDVEAIKASLDRFGQRYPLVVRGGVVQAGNHRVMAAQELGWTELAVVDADDLTEDEARAFAAADNRTGDLGAYDLEELAEWLAPLDDDLLLAAGYDSDALDELLAGPDDQLYSRKIEAPTYEPTSDEPPPIADLCDTTRTDALLAAIEQADLDPGVAGFLRAAAQRHTRFWFDSIAEFYAHAPPEVQALMEASALVIIDWDQAVEEGFVVLSQGIADQYALEHGDDDSS